MYISLPCKFDAWQRNYTNNKKNCHNPPPVDRPATTSTASHIISVDHNHHHPLPQPPGPLPPPVHEEGEEMRRKT
jgi:hypothetical protein